MVYRNTIVFNFRKAQEVGGSPGLLSFRRWEGMSSLCSVSSMASEPMGIYFGQNLNLIRMRVFYDPAAPLLA